MDNVHKTETINATDKINYESYLYPESFLVKHFFLISNTNLLSNSIWLNLAHLHHREMTLMCFVPDEYIRSNTSVESFPRKKGII